jgi:hypothetical protein
MRNDQPAPSGRVRLRKADVVAIGPTSPKLWTLSKLNLLHRGCEAGSGARGGAGSIAIMRGKKHE